MPKLMLVVLFVLSLGSLTVAASFIPADQVGAAPDEVEVADVALE